MNRVAPALLTFLCGSMVVASNSVEQRQGRVAEFCESQPDEVVSRLPADLGYRQLAECYRDGIGREADIEKAFNLFRKAGEAGDTQGFVEASILILTGDVGVKGIEITTAVSMLRLGHENDDPIASYWLGLLYVLGRGVPQDLDKANELFNRSLYLEYQTPLLFFYYAYSRGVHGYPKDPYTASLYLERLMGVYGEDKGAEYAEELADDLAQMLDQISGDNPTN